MKKFFIKFFSSFSGYCRRLGAKISAFIIKEAPVTVQVVDVFRMIIDNPITDIAVKLTPTPVDDMLVAKAKASLPKVLLALQIARGVKEDSSLEDILYAAKKELDLIDPVFLRGKFKNIADEIGVMISDGKFDWADVGHGIEYAVQQIRKAEAKKAA